MDERKGKGKEEPGRVRVRKVQRKGKKEPEEGKG